MALVKKLKKTFTKEDYNLLATNYDEISSQIKELEKTKKVLADRLKEGAKTLGTEDDKGSFYIEGEDYIIGNVVSKSMSYNLERATPILKKKKIYNDCTETITTIVVDDAKLTKLVEQGKITLNEVKDFTDVKETFKVYVKKKEEIPDIEVTTFATAAKRKAGNK